MSQRIDMDGGYVVIGSGINDILVYATTGDPINIKVGTPEGISLGAVCWGRIRPDGGFEQKVLFQGKIAENTRNNPDIKEQGGEFTVHCHDGIKHYLPDGSLHDDSSMRLALMARYDAVWVRRLVTVSAEMPDGLPGWQTPAPPPQTDISGNALGGQ